MAWRSVAKLRKLLGELDELMSDIYLHSQDRTDAATRDGIRKLLLLRRRREVLFPQIDFGEPAWDMLLDLYLADSNSTPVSITSACIAASVPQTTALRTLNGLVEDGLVVRSRDPRDARRSHVKLEATTRGRIESLFAR